MSLFVTRGQGRAALGAVVATRDLGPHLGALQEGLGQRRTGPTEGWGQREPGQAGREDTEGRAPAAHPFPQPGPAPSS